MFRSNLRRNPEQAFTIVEMVVVMVIVGILAGVALPRFVGLQGDAATAQVENITGSMNSAVQLAHAKWRAQGGGATVALEGSTVDVNAAGWPSQPGGAPMTEAGCLALWDGLLSSAPPAALGYNPGTDGYGALASNALCAWAYEADVTPLRIVIYDTASGRVWIVVI